MYTKNGNVGRYGSSIMAGRTPVNKTKAYFLWLVFTVGLLGMQMAQATGWSGSYLYRKTLAINSGVGAGTGYQIQINVGESAGSASADIQLSGNALNFPNDIHFTGTNGTTSLACWLEKTTGTTPNRTATFWVKVNDSLDSSTSIYVYYNLNGGLSDSNGTNTFDFFEGFDGSSIDASKWTIDNSTGFSVAGGELKGANNSGRIRSIATFSSGALLEIKSRTVSKPANGFQIGGFYSSGGQKFGFLNYSGNEYYYNNGSWSPRGSEISYAGVNMLTRIAVRSASQVDFSVNNYDTGASLWAVGTVNNVVSSESITLGYRYVLQPYL